MDRGDEVSTEERDKAWGEFRDSRDYTPTDRYPVREVWDAAWDARGQVTPEEEAVKKVVLDVIYAERIEEGHPAKNTIRYELAEAITQSVLALFNGKGNE